MRLATSLCATGTCIDRWIGYTCSANDYIQLNMCREQPDWFCPSNSTYDFMATDECPINKCLEAANLGLQLCDAGVADCENVNMTYRCRRGVPLLDECNEIGEEINLLCPRLTKDTPNLASFGSTLLRIAHNARALRQVDPDYFLGLTNGLTDDRLQSNIESHSEEERHQIANRLLDTLTQTLDSDVDIHVHPTSEHIVRPKPAEVPVHSDFRPKVVLAQDKVEYTDVRTMPTAVTATSLTTATPHAEQKPISAMQKVRTASALLHMVATLARSSWKVQQMFDRGQANRNGVQFLKPMTYAACHQLQQSVDNKFSHWSKELCETIVVGLHYECRCRPRERGTFAIALVYWIGDAEIPPEHEYVITLVNYIFTSITILALLLFLIFTRFVGVFRLDQFNIAFCLMISAIVSLIIPFVTNKQPIGCVILAIAVCFFPLAAFSWKFIFGLNTLILIVAPQSRYHELVSRHRHCVPLVWIGYIIPAVIVGVWFGYAEKVHTQKLHLLVLTQLMLTLGIPYIAIYIQFLDPYTTLIVVPVAMALTAVLMFLLVAVIDEENRQLLQSFIRTHFTRTTSVPPSGPGSPGSHMHRKISRGQDGYLSSGHEAQGNKPFTPGKRVNHGRWFMPGRNPVKADSDPQTTERLRLNGPRGNGHGTAQALSETGNTELTFEPGWLHRYPATAALHNGRTTPVSASDNETQTSNPSVALPSSVQPDNGLLRPNPGLLNVVHTSDSSGNGTTGHF
ncbi:Cadherin EGF LAG seven pass G type receptor [Fasciola hepatica]|uniref:Cadherin EGF LAG seven pass G type receptor n=1 Tax=Fasciola hepatica TaxID=6192 RepID=A0A4E0RRL7_FASHE|nr:Cadherin EGF LAG seven pass G type receptor [Fasciola hepatica]